MTQHFTPSYVLKGCKYIRVSIPKDIERMFTAALLAKPGNSPNFHFEKFIQWIHSYNGHIDVQQ